MDVVVELFRHNAMMNRRLLDVCQELAGEELAATVPGTYGSIGATLVHIANSQVGYVPRFVAAEKPDPLPESPFPGFEVVRDRFAYGDALLVETAQLAGEGRQIQVSGDDPPGTWRLPAALILLQAVNHSTEHRSQVATILTQLGVQPPPMDGWTYFHASGQMVAQ